MAQIIDGPYDPGSTGEGIKSGIQALMNHHIERKLQKKQYDSQYKVAKALGLPNAEGLAHADPKIFEQLIKRGPSQSSGNNQAFNDYLNGSSQQDQSSPMQELQNGPMQGEQPEQQGQMPEQQMNNQQPQNDAVAKALQALDSPEAQRELGPEGVENLRKILGGQSGQGQQLGGQQAQRSDNEQQLYERALAGSNSESRAILKEVRSSRQDSNALNVKLAPLDEKYAERVQNRAEIADEIEPILDNIEQILKKGPYSSKNPEGFNTGFIESLSPVGLLKNSTTQDLNNLINALITKQATLESQGKGSDLLRNMIKDGKLSLAQKPTSLNNTFERLKKSNEEDQKKAETLQGILQRNEGKSVGNLREKVKKQLNAPVLIDDAGQKWKMINGKPVRA